jgi:hypothetical protein
MTTDAERAVDAWLEEIIARMPPSLRRGKCRVTLHIAGADVRADVEYLGIVVQSPRDAGQTPAQRERS